MKKMVFGVALVLASTISCAFADEEIIDDETSANKYQKLSREELMARRYAHTGGYVVKPNSQQGCVVIFNAQKRVSSPELQGVVNKIVTKLGYKAEVRDVENVTIATAEEIKVKEGATVAVYVVDDPQLPISLVAYEGHWGIVNIAKLAEGADKVRLFGRANAETMRVVALASGAADSQFPSSLMKDVKRVRGLDGMDGELPYDVMNRMVATYKLLGMSPERKSTYRNACKEGWAPAPVDDIQKAIWDEVHATPSEPIKIKHEKK